VSQSADFREIPLPRERFGEGGIFSMDTGALKGVVREFIPSIPSIPVRKGS